MGQITSAFLEKLAVRVETWLVSEAQGCESLSSTNSNNWNWDFKQRGKIRRQPKHPGNNKWASSFTHREEYVS